MAVIPIDELPELTHQFDGLDTFIVGGWVRDKLRPDAEPNDVDLMVTGVTPEEMRERKFKEIDSSNNDTFGVFQDAFGREVALAREESSTGDGYRDFDVEPVDPSVRTMEALARDLRRRDFTVNAMAVNARTGEVHDPHKGRHHLDSPHGLIAVDRSAFKQDPLRILRGARFAARLDTDLHSETKELMQEMSGALPELPSERIRLELEKTFKQADTPRVFFDMLAAVGALEHTFPELSALVGVPAGPDEFHGERDSLHHTMLVLSEMQDIRPNDETALLMVLSHDLGKAETPRSKLPSHPKHSVTGLDVVDSMAERLSMSNSQQKAMRDSVRYHMQVSDIDDLRESTVISLVQDAADPARLVSLSQADTRGRIPSGEFDEARAFERFAAASQAIEEWHGQSLIDEGYSPEEMGGEAFGNLLNQKRVELMRELES